MAPTAPGDVKVVHVPVEELNEFEGNPRQRTEKVLEHLKKSILEFGFVDPVIVWANAGEFGYPSNTILGGHRRLDAYKSLIENGEVEPSPVPCVPVTLDAVEKAKALNVALNKIGEEFDLPGLSDWLAEIDVGNIDMEVTGFTDEEIAELLDYEPKGGLTDDDTIPEAGPAICKAGDLWELGDHRLLCGDATKAEDVERLMDGEKADMVFTDPPYNVDYGANKKHPSWKNRSVKGDRQSASAWEEFNRAWIGNAMAITAGDIYVWGAPGPEGMRQRLILVELGGHWSATIIWYKSSLILSPAKYQRIYEPCFYGWFGGKSSFRADRKQREVWEFKRPSRSDEHPTMKPVAMCAYGIKNSSVVGGIVWDGFGGSGSTLIACEKTNRRCYGMEIDPHYCDVIIKRWEEFTGRRAELVENADA